MHRVLLRLPAAAPRRSFVSSVLLTRTWENQSVADLKRELKIRGLSPKRKGNKANLILRIQEHDKNKTLDAITSRTPPVPVQTRSASSDAAVAAQGVTPGIPPASQSTRSAPELFMNTNLPDISQPDPELPVQIPFYPDFWDSSAVAPKKVPEVEEPLPKLLVVAGADTHPGGGPSHNLHDENAPTEPEPYTTVDDVAKPHREGGLWDDIVQDLGLPPRKDIKNSFWKLFS